MSQNAACLPTETTSRSAAIRNKWHYVPAPEGFSASHEARNPTASSSPSRGFASVTPATKTKKRFSTELHARVHALITDRILAVDQSANVLSDVPKEQVLQCISDLESARLLYREENRILGLALPAACYDHQKARLKMLEETLVAG